MIKTKITELFGIQHPIVQGGMQHVSRANLVAAVSNGGGLGMLTASNFTCKDDLVAEIRKIKSMTNKPFGLNMSTSALPEAIQQNIAVVLEEKIAVVETSGRNPGAVIAPLKAAGVKVFHKIPHARFAKKLEDQGFDAIAVVGFEAGGHPGPFGVTSEIATMEVLNTAQIPVIMGGGVYDGRGLLAALSYGAEGILMGTRFLASAESEIHQSLKEWAVNAATTDTLMVKSDNPNRVAKTKAAYRVLGMEHGGRTLDEIQRIMVSMKGKNAWDGGNLEECLHSMGQIVGLIKEIKPCKQIMEDIVSEAEALFANKLKKEIL